MLISHYSFNEQNNKLLNMTNINLHTYLNELKPEYIYLNSSTEKLKMLKELKSISGIYLWCNNITDNYYTGSVKDLSNRLASPRVSFLSPS